MAVTDDYLAHNAGYARSFEGPLPMPPSKHVAVVACMDARLDVYRILGLREGRPTSSETPAASSPTTWSAHWPSANGCWEPGRSS